jgi:protein phosphatase
VGNLREHQEDGVFVDDVTGVYAVFDGMGAWSGQVATAFLLAHLEGVAQEVVTDPRPDAWGPYLRELNDALVAYIAAVPEYRGAGATGAMARVRPGWCDVAHVGDARAYLWRRGVFVAQTRDDSLLEEYMRLGLLTPDQLEDFPYRTVVTRALGFAEGVNAHMQSWPVEPGDRVLLCSDGVHREVYEDELARVLSEHPGADEAAEALVSRVLAGPAGDNLSLVVLEVGEGPAPVARGEDAWGELRGRMHGADRVDWEGAVEAIEAFRGAGGEVTGEVVEYVRGVLRGWEGERVTPVAWINDARHGVAARPELALCDTFAVPEGWWVGGWGREEVSRGGALSGVRRVRLNEDAVDPEDLEAWLRVTGASELEGVELTWRVLNDERLEALSEDAALAGWARALVADELVRREEARARAAREAEEGG